MEKQFKERDQSYFCVVYENLYPLQPSTKRLMVEDGSIIYETNDVDSYTFFDYYNHYYTGTSLYYETIPHLLYTGMGSIKQLETLNYDNCIVEYLNAYGLNIYLYETTVVDTLPKKKFYVTQNKEYPVDYINFRFENDTNFYVLEFESIDDFVKRNNLTNVTVYTCEGQTSELINYSFKIKSKEIFLLSLLKESNMEVNGYEINKNLIDYFDYTTITHKFWLGNWRYDVHRHVLCTHLADKSVKMSWYYNSTFEEVKKFFWFDITKWINYDTLLLGQTMLIDNSPYIIDIPAPAKKVDTDQLWTIPTEDFFCPGSATTPLDSYTSCFCAVVTESNFAHPFPMFSEKVVNAIKAGRPFIVASSAGTLEYLRQHGFKTFSDFWDESYDLERNHEQRLLGIIKLIDDMDKLSIAELQKLYQKIKPTVEYNFRWLGVIRDKDLSF